MNNINNIPLTKHVLTLAILMILGSSSFGQHSTEAIHLTRDDDETHEAKIRLDAANNHNLHIETLGPSAIKMATNNVERLTILADGKVGIGTSVPSSILDVTGTVTATSFIGDGSQLSGISGSSLWSGSPNISYDGGKVGVGITNPGRPLHIYSTTDNRPLFFETYELPQNGMLFRGTSGGLISTLQMIMDVPTTARTQSFRWNFFDSGPGVSAQYWEFLGVERSHGFKGAMHLGRGTGGNNAANSRCDVYVHGSLDVKDGVDVVGNITASGSVFGIAFISNSDERFKTNFKPLENAIEKVQKIQGLYYKWRQDEYPEKNFNDKTQLGFKAQEVEKVFPEIVFTDKDGYKSVDYARMTVVLLEAIKEQQKTIENQQQTLSLQGSNMAAMSTRIDELFDTVNKLDHPGKDPSINSDNSIVVQSWAEK